MGKCYCDYCDVFLTNDSVAVRKQHNEGNRHKYNVCEYYRQYIGRMLQEQIDDIVEDFEIKVAKGLIRPTYGLPPAVKAVKDLQMLDTKLIPSPAPSAIGVQNELQEELTKEEEGPAQKTQAAPDYAKANEDNINPSRDTDNAESSHLERPKLSSAEQESLPRPNAETPVRTAIATAKPPDP